MATNTTMCCDCGADVPLGPRGGIRERCAVCESDRLAARSAPRPPRSRPERLCANCGAPTPASRRVLCDRCRAASLARHSRSSAERKHPKSSAARGYGQRHRRLRKQWKLAVERGEVICGRCGRYIDPGTPWDLGHPQDNKALEPRPWHARCNRQFAATVTGPRKRGNLR